MGFSAAARKANRNSVRIGRFRVVYRVVRDIVEILTIGPRRTVYEEAERLAGRHRI